MSILDTHVIILDTHVMILDTHVVILDTHHFRHAPGTKVAHHNFHITTKMSKIASKSLPKVPKSPREVTRRSLDSRRRFHDVSSLVVFACIFFGIFVISPHADVFLPTSTQHGGIDASKKPKNASKTATYATKRPPRYPGSARRRH